jgi:hypothetical protein
MSVGRDVAATDSSLAARAVGDDRTSPSLVPLGGLLALVSVADWGTGVLIERSGVGPTQSGPTVEGVDEWS